MSFIQQPAYILSILFLLIVFSEWLTTKKYFHHLGSVLIIILSAAVLANLKVIPSSQNAPLLYDKIFDYAAPLGIFFLLLEVRLSDLRKAGMPMLTMFGIGAAATMIGVFVGYWFLAPQLHIPQAPAIAGMFTGTYTGGSANLNAVAIQYGLQKEGTLYAAINAADNILTTFWILMTLMLPVVLQKHFPRKKATWANNSIADENIQSMVTNATTPISISNIASLLFLGFGSMTIASLCAYYFPAVPSILALTTLALVLGQLPYVQKLKGSNAMGMILIMLFLAVIGAYCDIRALIQSGTVAKTLLVWDTVIVLIHGVLIFGIGGLLKQDWAVIAVASNAGIGGASSAPACAASIGRPDLQLPGILAGSLGLAVGSYLGILVTELLK